MSKLLQHPAALMNIARRVALEAGRITLEYFDESGSMEAEEKEDGSPVTEADRAAERYIIKALDDIVPGIPVIAEESAASGESPDVAGAEFFWSVDPLDGTKAFVAGEEDYTVNIALVRAGRPIVGVIYAPVLGEMYAGCEGGEALRWLEDTNKEKNIFVRKAPASGLSIVTSKTNPDRGKLESYLGQFKVEKLTRRRSALKFCMIASGRADFYPRLGDTYEWDTAAGEAILRAAGGDVVTFEGDPLSYGRADQAFLNPSFIAGETSLIRALTDDFS